MVEIKQQDLLDTLILRIDVKRRLLSTPHVFLLMQPESLK